MAGPTYCERLWCVMEIFVFLHMGGSLDRITIEIIAHPDTVDTDARQLLTAQFACFDAAKAQCFKVEDREKLLAVIEAAFGDFREFNQCVRDVFAERTVTSSMSRLPVARACLASGGEAASVDGAAQQVEAAPGISVLHRLSATPVVGCMLSLCSEA